MTPNIKPNTATQAKKRWNERHYTQIKASVDPDVAVAFKMACVASNVSMAAVLTQLMTEYSNAAKKHEPTPDYSTRRVRRAAMARIVRQMEEIMAAEEKYRDNIPENLRGSVVFDKADESVSLLEETIELLGSIY
jgi:stalled ribosome rescue protein Dom34